MTPVDKFSFGTEELIIQSSSGNFFIAIAILTILNFSEGKSIIPYTEIGVVGKNGIGRNHFDGVNDFRTQCQSIHCTDAVIALHK